MNLHEWATRWGIPYDAIRELKEEINTDPPIQTGLSESAVQNIVRLEASKKGARLWRNNVGVLLNADGKPVRYGLCNDSKQMNQVVKSSDLIGIKPVVITADMVGTTIGQFVAREVKEGRWSYSGSEREQAQMNFINLVLSLGGDAMFVNGEGSL